MLPPTEEPCRELRQAYSKGHFPLRNHYRSACAIMAAVIIAVFTQGAALNLHHVIMSTVRRECTCSCMYITQSSRCIENYLLRERYHHNITIRGPIISTTIAITHNIDHFPIDRLALSSSKFPNVNACISAYQKESFHHKILYSH